MAVKNFYQQLAVEPSASSEAIKRAYYLLAKRLHPDSGNSSAGHSREFHKLQMAYDTLKDPKLRARYDRSIGIQRSFGSSTMQTEIGGDLKSRLARSTGGLSVQNSDKLARSRAFLWRSAERLCAMPKEFYFSVREFIAQIADQTRKMFAKRRQKAAGTICRVFDAGNLPISPGEIVQIQTPVPSEAIDSLCESIRQNFGADAPGFCVRIVELRFPHSDRESTILVGLDSYIIGNRTALSAEYESSVLNGSLIVMRISEDPFSEAVDIAGLRYE